MDTAALVGRMVDSFNRRDTEAHAARYAPGARVHLAGWPEEVDAGTWLAVFGVMLQTFPDLLLHPRNLAADDRVALLEARLTGTNTGPFGLSDTDRLVLGTQAQTLPATGRAIDITGTVVLEVAGGRVTAERHYWPLVDTLVQLGLVGPRPSRPDGAGWLQPLAEMSRSGMRASGSPNAESAEQAAGEGTDALPPGNQLRRMSQSSIIAGAHRPGHTLETL